MEQMGSNEEVGASRRHLYIYFCTRVRIKIVVRYVFPGFDVEPLLECTWIHIPTLGHTQMRVDTGTPLHPCKSALCGHFCISRALQDLST